MKGKNFVCSNAERMNHESFNNEWIHTNTSINLQKKIVSIEMGVEKCL